MNKQIEIIVAEDEFIIQMYIESVLTDLGCKISGVFATGFEVVELAQQKMPDLILMDIGLKGEMDGIETANLLKKIGNIEIIYITGNTDESTYRRAMETQPIAFISKPIKEDLFIEELERTLEVLKK